ncbi:hypothetical protein EI94DRAFT_1741908, partial [Lactarius quietus]
MRFACCSFVPPLLVLLAQTSVAGSGEGTGIVTRDTLSIRPPLCLDGSSSSDSPQNGTPAGAYAYPLSAPTAAGPAPAPVLAIGMLAMLWFWVLDAAAVPGWARGRADAARKDVCRCRVCTLRMQARGLPLHDVGARSAGSTKKAF